ncbi:hypothetical protein MJO28_002615 [Puccinia striiformis f. sp. tritici]|uniref:Uncharacterized protein n=1 Tax=Puccinia striiformis f. sp. tritici TaxID=168172 RepID=A0ACC0ER63_9BASI|nr:hypothetical protein Pst134EB_006507 [Puccinia striiformis f. sp. tritici]KAI7958824.1 hypothetical protein MJO28_002615 [Puccinia striiformis f. sp. tritici]
MSFGRGGGRGGRGGRGGGGAGRGALENLSLGTLSFADLLATSRADIGDVLYPTAGVNLPVTDLASNQEAQTVASEVNRWLYPAYPSSRQCWVIEGDLKPSAGSSKTKQRPSLAKPFIHQFSKLDLQPESSTEDWLYSDRYKTASSTDAQLTGNKTNGSDKSKYLHLLDKSFFPPDLWTTFSEGKKKTIIKKTKGKRANGKSALAGLTDDLEGQEDGDVDKDDKEDEEEVGVIEEEEIDEDDPDYDNNYFDNGDADEGMESGGEGGDDGGVF